MTSGFEPRREVGYVATITRHVRKRGDKTPDLAALARLAALL